MFLNLTGERIPGQVMCVRTYVCRVFCVIVYRLVRILFSHRFPVFELSFLSYILCTDEKKTIITPGVVQPVIKK